MTREHYGQELADLRASVVAMASMTNKAIDNAVTALTRRDVRLAEHVIAADRAINEHRWRTEEQALLVIATQAPMARDLRMIAAVIHIVTDLERMADHAAGTAKIAIQTADQAPLKPLVDPTTIDQATHLLWAAHNLERIADRVTNLCERVVFAATGQLEELAVSTY